MFSRISPSATVETVMHPFDIIYQAAKEQDAQKITEALQHVGIDVQKKGNDSVPISQLAFEKDIDSVNFLRERFSASLVWMAFGYAQGGHTTEAGNVLVLAASVAERVSILEHMVSGYVRGGHTTEVFNVLTLTANPDERIAILIEMAYRYARGGYTTEGDNVLKLAANPDERVAILEYLVVGYAQYGYTTKAENVLKLAESDVECAVILNFMAMGYAQGGHSMKADNVLTLVKSDAERTNILKNMAYGYALGGHTAEASNVLTLASPTKRVAILNLMAAGYAQGGYITEAGNVLTLVESAADLIFILQHIAYGAKLNGSELVQSIALQGLALEDTDETRMVLARELKESKFATTYDIMTLVPQAKKINQVMRSHQLTFAQGLAWTQPEVQIWFLQCAKLVGNGKREICEDMFLLISLFLSPLSNAEAANLSDKVYAHSFKARNLDNLSEGYGLLSVRKLPDAAVPVRNNSSSTKLHNHRLFQSASVKPLSGDSSSLSSSEKKNATCCVIM